MNRTRTSALGILCILLLVTGLWACDEDDESNDPVIEPGLYEVTYVPDGGSEYTEYIKIERDGKEITATVCTGFVGSQYDARELHGKMSGSEVLLRGGSTAFMRGDWWNMDTIPDLFYFWAENFDLLAKGTWDLGPVINNEVAAVSFHNSFFGNAPKPYFDGYETSMHAYGGSVTISSFSPNITGTFALENLTTKHYPGATLTGTASGSFSIPFNGSAAGTFTCAGEVDGMPFSVSIDDARLESAYRVRVVVDKNGSLHGEYEVTNWVEDESGSFTMMPVEGETECPR